MLVAAKLLLNSLMGIAAETLLTLAGWFALRRVSGKGKAPSVVTGEAGPPAPPTPAPQRPAVKLPKLSLNFTQSATATLLEFLFLAVFGLLYRQEWVALAATGGMLLCSLFILRERK